MDLTLFNSDMISISGLEERINCRVSADIERLGSIMSIYSVVDVRARLHSNE